MWFSLVFILITEAERFLMGVLAICVIFFGEMSVQVLCF
jgi:hypothetical protein